MRSDLRTVTGAAFFVTRGFGGEGDGASTATAAASTAFAGGLAAVLTNPLDVAAARLMVQGRHRPVSGNGGGGGGGGGSGGERLPLARFRGTIHCLRETWRLQGIHGLMSGSVPRLLSIAPLVSLQFAVYEAIKQYLFDGDIESFDVNDL